MTQRISFFLLFLCCYSCSQAQWTTVCGTGNDMVVSLVNFNGSTYAAGFFTTICGTPAKGIARWDGTSWYPVDTGLSDAGHNLEVLNNELYVAQYKQSVDSNWVEKWDGSHFVRIGEGVYLTIASLPPTNFLPNIYDVAMYNGKLIACGEFDRVGNKRISGIMQWNGTQWDSLGSGLSGSIDGPYGILYPHQLLVHDTSLYVVGDFANAGGISVNGIARWDGTQWHSVGVGFNRAVYCIGIINNEIYVGGEFTQSGTTQLQRIAKWNGTSWVNPGFGVCYKIPGIYPYVHTIKQIGTRGVFEGGFDRVIVGIDTFVANNIIAYNGLQIDTLSGGVLNANFEGLTALDSSTILVGGAVFGFSGPDTTLVAKYHFANLGISTVKTNNINIFPNPFTDVITLQNVPVGSDVTLCNMLGQHILHTITSSKQDVLQLQQLPYGTYLLQISDTDGTTVYKKISKL